MPGTPPSRTTPSQRPHGPGLWFTLPPAGASPKTPSTITSAVLRSTGSATRCCRRIRSLPPLQTASTPTAGASAGSSRATASWRARSVASASKGARIRTSSSPLSPMACIAASKWRRAAGAPSARTTCATTRGQACGSRPAATRSSRRTPSAGDGTTESWWRTEAVVASWPMTSRPTPRPGSAPPLRATPSCTRTRSGTGSTLCGCTSGAPGSTRRTSSPVAAFPAS
mmetsp:Transcript_10985/g.19634  ORF Transcript_10985/g.19634 Transcript_10985/m.19634 type:complete len:227 (+) Transcript_10985:853-1533(+)